MVPQSFFFWFMPPCMTHTVVSPYLLYYPSLEKDRKVLFSPVDVCQTSVTSHTC